MAKATKKKKEITLKEIAIEMNDVMEYGLDRETGEVNMDDCINIKAKDAVLLEEIKKRAADDLRVEDEEAFSPEAWQWFIDNDITPSDADPDEEEEEDEEEECEDNGEDEEEDEEEEDEEDEEPAPKKSSKKAPVKETKSAAKKKGGAPSLLAGAIKGNEKIAQEIVLSGGDLDDCIKEFVKIYKKAGKADGKYEYDRAKIYYNKAVRDLTASGQIKGTFVGKTVLKKDAEDEPAPKKKAAAAPAKAAKPAQKASQKLAKKK